MKGDLPAPDRARARARNADAAPAPASGEPRGRKRVSRDGSDLILDRMMALHPKMIDLTLDRVWRLLAALGHPERRLPPVIHIAGTNGKGSTLAMIRAGLEGAGQTRPRLHLAASGAVPRAHPAGGRPDHRRRSSPRCSTAARRPTAAQPITYFEITTVRRAARLRRDPGRLDPAGGRPRRPARCDQRGRQAGADGHHPGLDRPHPVSRRHAARRSPAKRPGSSSAACRWWSARSRTTALEVIEAGAARARRADDRPRPALACLGGTRAAGLPGRDRAARSAAARAARPAPDRERRRRARRPARASASARRPARRR